MDLLCYSSIKEIGLSVNCTIRGAVSGEKRFQNINPHIGTQQIRNPPAT